MNSVERDFADALSGAGLEAFGQLRIRADGRIHRYRLADDRPGKKNGWFVLHDGAAPFGFAGDWKSGHRLDWIALEINGNRIEQGAFEEARKRLADEQQAAWAGAQSRAQHIWARLPIAQADHPYLAKKQVAPGACRLTCNGRLVVPVYDADRDDLISLQFISGDGGKRFLAGGRTGGGHCRLGLLRGADTIIVCEGYATGATLHAATGDPVVIAFTCGNLLAVGKALRARYANARIVFAADNDDATAGNPGVSKAMEAAFEIGAVVAVPRRPGDFNDLASEYDIEAVRLSIAAALANAQAEAELDALVGPVREPDEMALVRLSRLTPLQYDRVRQAEAKKLGIKVSTLDEEVAKRRKRQKQSAEAPPPPKKTLKDLEAAAYDICTSHTVLDRFAEEIGKRVAGEEKNLKRLYLIATSRLFEKTMHAAIKGVTSSGKSEIRTEVLAFIPPEDVISFTTLSEKALLYMPDDFAHKILSHGRGTDGNEQDFQDYLLRELMSEGILRYPVPQKVGNDIVTVTIVKRGPVTFLVTTTRASLHQENETRMLWLETDDSEAQTEAVMEKIAEIEGEGSVEAIGYATWHDYQRWLAAGERGVVIPWARPLRKLIRASAVRLRRDFGQLLRAIKAHALLHRFHREQDAKGRIIATIDAVDDGEAGAPKVKGDYEAVRELFADIMAEAAEVKVSETVAATVAAVASIAAGRAKEGSQRQYPGDRRCDRPRSPNICTSIAALHNGVCAVPRARGSSSIWRNGRGPPAQAISGRCRPLPPPGI